MASNEMRKQQHSEPRDQRRKSSLCDLLREKVGPHLKPKRYVEFGEGDGRKDGYSFGFGNFIFFLSLARTQLQTIC